jgi:hypothetical protein
VPPSMATVLSLPRVGNHQRPSQHFNHRFAIDEGNMMHTTDDPIPTLLAKTLFRHAQFPSGKSHTDRSCVKNLGQVKQFCTFIETKPSLDSLRHKAPNPRPVHSPTCASPAQSVAKQLESAVPMKEGQISRALKLIWLKLFWGRCEECGRRPTKNDPKCLRCLQIHEAWELLASP